ncbi:NAD(P)H-hydrate dehydratase [Verrucomicrobiaceae bacterium 5K15]|uniref:ADP-dependent (S)-NAD(P)H-hydrate dehydratase n=1 Tax=Oceaniferula flava TaxID=2800421 RepID=A0AAE2VBR7_9BACT|nr:NAD(P)H-hydrate dehydratase [Oceaniferula flavus]MBK1854820.1 NAD(P)H-hydrate dehydratase [Oceaniferula flavus]MBM1136126.1 NAD(P)H-hydrate dehydratase [Oceaniferula flavus]
MRDLEHRAFAQGATPEGLMDQAGAGIAREILRRYPRPGVAIACIGSGNNGGDALVALKHLAQAGWNIAVKPTVASAKLAELPWKKWRALGDMPSPEAIMSRPGRGKVIVLDGLLGIGASGALREPLASAAAWMNDLRISCSADVIAMDIPSGVNGDSGEVYDGAVIADLTLTIGVAKSGLLQSSSASHTGSMETIPVDELPAPDDGSPSLSDRFSLRSLPLRRPHEFHKGNAGRVGIVAGSRGMLGAAVLCATGVLRSGAGLVTLFVEENIYSLLVPMLPPEVMVKPVTSLTAVMEQDLDVLAIGPGMGSAWSDEEFFRLIEDFSRTMVVDADALNRIAADGVSTHVRGNMILTPHPGEMRRLFPDSRDVSRESVVSAFTQQFPSTTLLLKGTHSLVAQDGQPLQVNASGHSGMASGGQGDVLTGVIAGLAGQGIAPMDAARAGAWLCGRAAELAISHGDQSQPSLTASDVLVSLGLAFREIL